MKATFLAVQTIVAGFRDFKPFFNLEFLRQWLPPASTAIFQFMLAFDDGIIKDIARKEIDELVSKLGILWMTLERADESGRTVESFKLDWAYAGLLSANFTRRLEGLVEITELITAAVKRSKHAYYMAGSAGGWANPERLAKWLEEKKILVELFGKRTHEQLVQRSEPVVSLLISRKAFGLDSLELLWNCSHSKTGDFRTTLFALLIQIVPSLECEQESFLVAKIEELTLSEIDADILLLLKKLILSSLRSGERAGLGLLWRLTVSWPPLPLSRDAMTVLDKCIAKEAHIRPGLLQDAVGLLAADGPRAIGSALKVIMSILETYPQSRLNLRNEESRAAALGTLIKERALVDVFFKDLAGFETAQESKGLKVRMNFLTYLLHNASIDLTHDHIDVIWGLAENKVLQSYCMGWLSGLAASNNSQYVVQPSSIAYLFSKICTLKAEHSTLVGFKCFSRFFKLVNIHERRLQLSSGGGFTVNDFALVGLDSLWRFVLSAESEEVSDAAKAFLHKLYTRVSKPLQRELTALFDSYIGTVLAFLKKTPAQGDRAMQLLRRFCAEFDSRATESAPPSSDRGLPLSVKVVQIDDLEKIIGSREMLCYSKDTLDVLRDMIAAQFRCDPDSVLLKEDPSNSDDDGLTLERLEIEDHGTLHFSLASSHGALVGSPLVTDINKRDLRKSAEIHLLSERFEIAAPSSILSVTYFNQLLDLLEMPAIADSVWQVIASLPLNPRLLAEIQHPAATPAWNKLFDSAHAFKLRYTLRICSKILEQIEERERWCDGFVSSGGLTALQSCISAPLLPLAVKAPALSLLNFFLLDGPSFRSQLGAWKIEVSPLLRLMLQFIDSTRDAALTEKTQKEQVELVSEACRLLNAAPEAALLDLPLEGLVDNLLHQPQGAARTLIAETLLTLARTSPAVGGRLMVSLTSSLSHLPQMNIDPQVAFRESFAEQYFAVLEALVSDLPIEKPVELVGQLAGLIMGRPVIELTDDSQEDVELIGLLRVLAEVISRVPADLPKDLLSRLTDHVFNECLFELPSAQKHGLLAPPKCKTLPSREAAFALLRQVIALGSVEAVLNHIDAMHLAAVPFGSNNGRHWSWDFAPSEKGRSQSGYAGIRNLGCICYMISLTQQLYHIPKFRKGILALDVPQHADEREDNLMFETQRMFTYLQETAKQYYDPTSFCIANKDSQGRSTNVNVQMDADEFWTMFCDKLESKLKGSIQEKLLDNIFGGKQVSQLICKGCPHRYDRPQPFFACQMEVKGCSSLEESLKRFVSGEMLEGDNAYMCEECKEKRDTLKRTCLGALPNTLILNLKRFDFDFDTFQRVKLNTYLSFPEDLDLLPYTVEGLAVKEVNTYSFQAKTPEDRAAAEAQCKAPNYYRYELKGVLIHRGTTDSGHYYSFIKERIRTDHQPAQWYEFNDHLVRPFDPVDLEKECFGGTEKLVFNGRSKTVEKTRNAYMLIYDRVNYVPTEETPEKEASEQPMPSHVKHLGLESSAHVAHFVSQLTQRSKRRKFEATFTVDVPKPLYQEVWEDNIAYNMDKQLFDPAYHSYVLDLLTQPQPSAHLVRTVTTFVLQIAVHAKGFVPKIALARLLPLLDTEHSTWLLEQFAHHDLIVKMVTPSDAPRRSFFAQLLLHCIDSLLADEDAELAASLLPALQSLKHLAAYDDEEYRYFDAYWGLWAQIVRRPQLRTVVVRLGVVKAACALLAEPDKKNGRLNSWRVQKRAEVLTEMFSPLTDFISYLVRTSSIPPYESLTGESSDEDEELIATTPYSLEETKEPLPQSVLQLVLELNYVWRSLKFSLALPEFTLMLQHLAYGSQHVRFFFDWQRSQKLLESIICCLQTEPLQNQDQVLAVNLKFFAAVKHICQIDDDLAATRAEYAVDSFLDTISKLQPEPKKVPDPSPQAKEVARAFVLWVNKNDNASSAYVDLKKQEPAKFWFERFFGW